MRAQHTRASNRIGWENSWSWLRRGDLKGYTEALVCSGQEQSLRINYTKHYLDKQVLGHCAECVVQEEK